MKFKIMATSVNEIQNEPWKLPGSCVRHTRRCHGLWRKTQVKKIITTLESVFYLFRQLSDEFCRHCSCIPSKLAFVLFVGIFAIFYFFRGYWYMSFGAPHISPLCTETFWIIANVDFNRRSLGKTMEDSPWLSSKILTPTTTITLWQYLVPIL